MIYAPRHVEALSRRPARRAGGSDLGAGVEGARAPSLVPALFLREKAGLAPGLLPPSTPAPKSPPSGDCGAVPLSIEDRGGPGGGAVGAPPVRCASFTRPATDDLSQRETAAMVGGQADAGRAGGPRQSSGRAKTSGQPASAGPTLRFGLPGDRSARGR